MKAWMRTEQVFSFYDRKKILAFYASTTTFQQDLDDLDGQSTAIHKKLICLEHFTDNDYR